MSQTPCSERARGGCASPLVHSITRRMEGAALPAAASHVPGRPLGPTRWWPGGWEQEALRLGGARAPTPVFGSSPPTTWCGRGRRGSCICRIRKVWWENRTLSAKNRTGLLLRIDHIWLIWIHTEPLLSIGTEDSLRANWSSCHSRAGLCQG